MWKSSAQYFDKSLILIKIIIMTIIIAVVGSDWAANWVEDRGRRIMKYSCKAIWVLLLQLCAHKWGCLCVYFWHVMCQSMAVPVCWVGPPRRGLEIPVQSALQAAHHPRVRVLITEMWSKWVIVFYPSTTDSSTVMKWCNKLLAIWLPVVSSVMFHSQTTSSHSQSPGQASGILKPKEGWVGFAGSTVAMMTLSWASLI